jgi:hypothetical protein
MAFSIKDWRNKPDVTTPINAASLEDMESRLSSYVNPHGSTHNPGGSDEYYNQTRGHEIPGRLEIIKRTQVNGAAATTNSGVISLVYFTVGGGHGPFTKIALAKGSLAGTGLTMARAGIYSIAANGDGTLVARTASQSTFESLTNAIPEHPFDTTGGYPASFTPTAGQRYASAYIFVGSNNPNYIGYTPYLSAFSINLAPKILGIITAQTDLLTSFTAAQVSNSSAPFAPYMHLAT